MASYDNPSDSAMPYYNQVPGTITPFYSQFINWGQQAGQNMSDVYGSMFTNPQGFYNNIMAGYNESPAYQYNQQQVTAQQAGTAAAGGYTGTPYDQQRQAETTSGLLAQDQNQYFNDVMGVQGQGGAGEQNLFDTGYRASSSLADELASNLAQQGNIAFQGTEYDNKLDSDRRNANLALLSKGIGSLGYLALM